MGFCCVSSTLEALEMLVASHVIGPSRKRLGTPHLLNHIGTFTPPTPRPRDPKSQFYHRIKNRHLRPPILCSVRVQLISVSPVSPHVQLTRLCPALGIVGELLHLRPHEIKSDLLETLSPSLNFEPASLLSSPSCPKEHYHHVVARQS